MPRYPSPGLIHPLGIVGMVPKTHIMKMFQFLLHSEGGGNEFFSGRKCFSNICIFILTIIYIFFIEEGAREGKSAQGPRKS